MKTIMPPRLHKGDKVAVISPSMPLERRMDRFERAIPALEKGLGIELVLGKHALGKHYYSSGTVEERLEDLHWAFSDPEIKAVFISVGGNTAIDLVDKIDYGLIKNNPKILTGISDATTLLTAIYAKTGLITFCGFEMSVFGDKPMDYQFESMKKTWLDGEIGEIKSNQSWQNFDELPTQYKGWTNIRDGKAEGKFLGGNLNSFYFLNGTEYGFDFGDSILFWETYKYSKKVIHHNLMKLRLNGVFDQIRGMVVGYCLGSDDVAVEGNERSIEDVLLETTDGYDFPIMWVGEIGHKVENFIQPIGARVSMDAKNLRLRVDESVVV